MLTHKQIKKALAEWEKKYKPISESEIAYFPESNDVAFHTVDDLQDIVRAFQKKGRNPQITIVYLIYFKRWHIEDEQYRPDEHQDIVFNWSLNQLKREGYAWLVPEGDERKDEAMKAFMVY